MNETINTTDYINRVDDNTPQPECVTTVTDNEPVVVEAKSAKEFADNIQSETTVTDNDPVVIEANSEINTEENINDESTTLTDDQVKEVYDSLQEADPDSINKLAEAEAETERSNYTEIEEMVPEDAPQVLPEDVVKQSILDYNMGISEDDALALAKVALEYRADKTIKVYDKMPDGVKKYIATIQMNINRPTNRSNKISKENAAKFFIDSFLNDAELQMALEEFNTQLNDAYTSMDSEISKLFSDAYEEEFAKIDEYRDEDPEKADRIEKIKNAFDEAKPPFQKLLDWIEPRHRKILFKRAEFRFTDETFYFNKLVNVTDVRVPNIRDLLEVIKAYMPDKTDIEVKRFIVAVCRHVMDYDFTDLGNVAYIYRFVDNIYKYKFLSTAVDDDESKALFGAISAVIDKINSL